MGMAAVRKNRSRIQTASRELNIPVEWGGDWKTLKADRIFSYHTEPIRHEALANAGVAFLLIVGWGTSMRLSWSLAGRTPETKRRPAP